MALSAIKNQDKVGLVLFSDRIERCIPPRKGRTAVMRIVREVIAAQETRRGTDIAGALRFLNRVQKRKAVVFLVSDFMNSGYEREIRTTARKHDLICCPISDPREAELPDAGVLEVQDPETGELVLLDTGSRAVRESFAARAAEERHSLQNNLRRLQVDTVFLDTSRPFIDDVHRLFRLRQARIGRG
jgi:uncharacterized protein (DUF58 family)